jgi:hypothetical protein
LERLYFRFQFCFVLFATINSWTPTNFFYRRRTPFFICQEHTIFHLDFYSDLVISLHQAIFRPLVYVGFHQKSCFKKVWMVLEKRKKFHAKSGTKRSLFRLRLRLLHAMLDVILIVCLQFLL